jgi:predicted AlkP superfamily pyrophosphatase or phosphodiesterase
LLGLGIALIVKVAKKPVTRPKAPGVATASNGTHTFQPTVLIISLDGFKPNYIDVGVTPNLHRLRETGVAPEYMKPSFPSVTFPNVRALLNLLMVALYFGYWIVS